MNHNGFSLVELIVIMVITGVLVSIAMLDYGNWNRKYTADSQLKTLYLDLMTARVNAFQQKKNYTVTIAANQYTMRNFSTAFDAAGTIVTQKTLSYPLAWSHGNTISFNSRGYTNLTTSQAVCMSSGVTMARDSILISPVRIEMGKVTEGAACANANITAK